MKKDDRQKGQSRKNTANIGGAAYAPQAGGFATSAIVAIKPPVA